MRICTSIRHSRTSRTKKDSLGCASMRACTQHIFGCVNHVGCTNVVFSTSLDSLIASQITNRKGELYLILGYF